MDADTHRPRYLNSANLEPLIGALAADGYQVVGPTIKEGAIVYGEIKSQADLPVGFTDIQEPGRYRLEKRRDAAIFGYAVGPHSWKKYLHLPTLRLWSANRSSDGRITLEDGDGEAPRLALLGVRACELAAIAIQDKVLTAGASVDTHYARRRANIFIVAANCIVAGGTCFCASMNTGPQVRGGYDIALTELIDGSSHGFLVEAGSAAGARILSRISSDEAGEDRITAAREVVAKTSQQMGRTLDTAEIKDLLYANLEHSRWDDVASRCLGCTNCTMVCPTCFCTTVEDHVDLTGSTAERVRQWDSCFTLDHSHVHSGSVRNSLRSRYRQWMTHKLASWIDQFGSSGCVGCGRCITWCPVGIDITEEAAAIRASDLRTRAKGRAV
ncbi:MAG TPA: 4Fe-4S dicluster domain-containing protein [Candidatus Binataceae bacterium]|nr:4Fe-4S dicluster domain-containing protein [Candidatus Binataceae bacterium]